MSMSSASQSKKRRQEARDKGEGVRKTKVQARDGPRQPRPLPAADPEDEAIAYYERKLGIKKGRRGKAKGRDWEIETGDGEDGLEDLLEGLEEASQEEEEQEKIETTRPSISVPWAPTKPSAEELYGNAPTQTSAKYVPPAQRKLQSIPTSKDRIDRLARLRPRLNGLLNRLGESNIAAVLSEIRTLYQEYPRNDVTSTFTDLLLENVASETLLLSTFLTLNASLATALYRIMGVEVGATLVQKVVTGLFDALEESTQGDERHQPSNLNRLCCEMFSMGLVSARLIFDLMQHFLERMDEISSDLLLRVLQGIGSQLRQDNPGEFKRIVLQIQNKAAEQVHEGRMKYLVESIAEIKVKKQRKDVGKDSDLRSTLKNWLAGLGKTTRLVSREPLDPSLDQIRLVDSNGPWWLQRDLELTSRPAMGKTIANDDPTNDIMSKISKKLGLNTELRRKIFTILTSGQDVQEAGLALEQLRLKSAQEREIIRVILRCVSMEKKYNPYYEELLRFLLIDNSRSKSAHGHRITLMYSFWDILRAMGEKDAGGLDLIEKGETSTGDQFQTSKRSRFHLAQLFGRLIGKPGHSHEKVILTIDKHTSFSNALTLSILKPLAFDRLQETTIEYVQTILVFLFIALKESEASFESIGDLFGQEAQKHRTLGLGLLLFLSNEMKMNELKGYMNIVYLLEDREMESLIRLSIDHAKEGLKSALRLG